MNLPFSQAQFFELFAAYNTAVWPAQIVLVLLAIVLPILALRWPERAGRPIAFALALLWGWLGIAYHLAFFRTINPAAPWFAAISLAQAIAFAWLGGIRGRLRFERGVSVRAAAGLLVIGFALLAYPAIGWLMGHRYPAVPSFGLPCPTTIFTFGVLLMASAQLPKVLLAGPLLWALIGSSAAFVLGVWQDLALLVVAGLSVYLVLFKAGAVVTKGTQRRSIS